jgi:predicted methyltransferase
MAVVLLAMGTVAEASDASGEGQRIVETLRLAAGMTAADVGAGEGKFTGVLARGVGPSGRVFAQVAYYLDDCRRRISIARVDDRLFAFDASQKSYDAILESYRHGLETLTNLLVARRELSVQVSWISTRSRPRNADRRPS